MQQKPPELMQKQETLTYISIVSDINEEYGKMIVMNNPGVIAHVYETIEDAKCSSCKERPAIGASCDPTDGKETQVGFFSSPCNPFSPMRAKRYAAGDARSHVHYNVTMASVVKLI